MDREAMDGEAMITDTREGAGAHGQTRALWWSCTTGACMHARARDGATARRDGTAADTAPSDGCVCLLRQLDVWIDVSVTLCVSRSAVR